MLPAPVACGGPKFRACACRSSFLLSPQVNSGLARQMIDKAKEKDLFLTEGLWTRWFPATQKCVTAPVAANGDLNAACNKVQRCRRQGMAHVG